MADTQQSAQQSDATFQDIMNLVWQHVTARDWHNNPPRGLAISIALEANELLEHFQWQEKSVGNKEALAAELADIFIYAFQFAATYDIDLPVAIRAKLEVAAKKYPAEQFKNKSRTETDKAWLAAKLRHRKEGL